MARTLIMSKKIRKVVKAVLSILVYRPKTNDNSVAQVQPEAIPAAFHMNQLVLKRRWVVVLQVCRNFPFYGIVAQTVHVLQAIIARKTSRTNRCILPGKPSES